MNAPGQERGGHEPQTYLEHATAAQQDPEPDIPGSVDDIVAAYDRGELSYAQYRTLAEAAAEGIAVKMCARKRSNDGRLQLNVFSDAYG